jgi:hypothetical protein
VPIGKSNTKNRTGMHIFNNQVKKGRPASYISCSNYYLADQALVRHQVIRTNPCRRWATYKFMQHKYYLKMTGILVFSTLCFLSPQGRSLITVWFSQTSLNYTREEPFIFGKIVMESLTPHSLKINDLLISSDPPVYMYKLRTWWLDIQ